MEGWHVIPVPLKGGYCCMAEHQVGQTRPAVSPRHPWGQPEHFRTNKNCLGLERGEQSAVEELMASQPFLWGYNHSGMLGR